MTVKRPGERGRRQGECKEQIAKQNQTANKLYRDLPLTRLRNSNVRSPTSNLLQSPFVTVKVLGTHPVGSQLRGRRRAFPYLNPASE